MDKLRDAIKNNTKTPLAKDTTDLLKSIRGGAGNDGWVKFGWKKKF